MKSDLVEVECEIDTNYEAWGLVAPSMSAGAPWVFERSSENGRFGASERKEFTWSPNGERE